MRDSKGNKAATTNDPRLVVKSHQLDYVSIAIRMMMGSGMPSSSSSIERIVFSLD